MKDSCRTCRWLDFSDEGYKCNYHDFIIYDPDNTWYSCWNGEI